MFSNKVIAEFKKVVGWDNHYDLTEIPALSSTLTDTETGMTYQNFYPSLVRLDYINAMLPSNYPLDTYLDKVETDSINELLSEVSEQKKLLDIGEDIAKSNIILPNQIKGNTITNEGRFVGVQFSLSESIGIQAVINRIGLYLTVAQPNLTIYLYNSLQSTAVATYTYTSTSANSFQWIAEEVVLSYDDGDNNTGGVWYVGYYQDDLVGSAIQYKSLNWVNGACSTCGGGLAAKAYKAIGSYLTMRPFYIASANVPAVGTLFDVEDMIYCNDNNFGFNFNISIKCDLSQYFIDNKKSFKVAIGRMVALKVLEMFIGSSQSSAVEQNLQALAIRAVEGATDTKQLPFSSKVYSAIKSINLDEGSANNSPCLPCARKGATIGVI